MVHLRHYCHGTTGVNGGPELSLSFTTTWVVSVYRGLHAVQPSRPDFGGNG